jgi:hypothetical protein
MNDSLVKRFTAERVTDHAIQKSADLTAAYMAIRPLAMLNQLTGCGKPESRRDEVLDGAIVWP